MSDIDRIYSIDLVYNNVPVPFAIKKIEEIDADTLGVEAYPHRHNYYSVIWPFSRKREAHY